MSGTAKGLNAQAVEFQPGSTGTSPTAPGGAGYQSVRSRPDAGYPYPQQGGGYSGYPPPNAYHGAPGFSSHTAHSGGFHPGFGQPAHPPSPHYPPGNFGPRAPDPRAFSNHESVWNRNNVPAPLHHPQHLQPPMQQQPMPLKKNVVLVMGAPRSGKRTVGDALAAKWGYVSIKANAADWVNRFDSLEQQLDHGINSRDVRGFVLSGFGADTDVDLYYIFHIIESRKSLDAQGQPSIPRLRIAYAVYLEMSYGPMVARLDGTVTSTTMAAYATGYEQCSTHFGVPGDPCFANFLVMDESNAKMRSTAEIVEEIARSAENHIHPQSKSALATPKAAAFDKWQLVTDYRLFKQHVDRLDRTLQTKVKDGVFPLRNIGGTLDYNRFSRHYNQLQDYDVLLATNGQRALIFKLGQSVYSLTEPCSCVYKLTDVPDTFLKHHAKGEDDLVFVVEADLCTIEHQGSTAAHVLLRDVLYFQGKTMDRTPWKERHSIISVQFGESSQQYVLPHVVHHIGSITELVDIAAAIENIVVGFRFEHPYGYRFSANATDVDARLLTWADGDKPLATLRLWNSTEIVKPVNGVQTPFYRFEVFVVDDASGSEKPLPEVVRPVPGARQTAQPKAGNFTIDISNPIVAQHQLNDGHIVECRYTHVQPPAVQKGPAARSAPRQEWYTAGLWTFVRRRNDLQYPHYESTVQEAITKPAWARDDLIAACKEIAPRPEPQQAAK